MVFTSVAMALSGNNTMILAILLFAAIAFLMFKLNIPSSFGVVAAILLFYVLAQLNPLFQSFNLIVIGLVGIGLVLLIFRSAGK
jgi:hypothetical protein